MANTQTFTTIIELNDQEAKKTLEQLQKKVENLRDARDKAISSKQSSAFIKDLNKQLKAAEAEVKAYETNVSNTISTINNLGDRSAGEIKKTMQALRKEQRAATNAEDYAKIEKHIQKCEERLTELARNTKLVNDTMNNLSGARLKDLEYTAGALNKRLKEVGRGTEEYKRLAKQLSEVKTAIKDINDETGESKGLFEKTKDFLNTNWGAITQSIAVAMQVSSSVRKVVDAYAQMDEAMANTRKYTGQSSEAVRQMNEDFKKLDTRTSREQLNELAGAAGRLGITSTTAIEEFVDAADKIGVALGDDLGEGAVDQIGKLAMSFGEDDEMGLRGAMLATGSAINELAQNSSANAGYLVDFAARVAGVGKQLGMTQTDIMGFGAVLDENMQKDEMAATAFGQLLTKMATDTGTFAKMAGKPVEEFSKMVRDDANGAVLTLMDSLRSKGDFGALGKMFGDMGLDGTRAVSVLTTIVDKIDDVREKQKIANEAYREGTSVIAEFEVQNSTIQAELDKAKKSFNEVAVELGESLMPIARSGLDIASNVIKALSNIAVFTLRHTEMLVTLGTAIGAYVVALKAKLVLDKLEMVYTATKTALVKAYTIASAVLTGKVRLATVAQHAWNAVVMANPLGAFVAAITAAAFGMAKFVKWVSDGEREQRKVNAQIEDANRKYREEKEHMEKLMKIAQDNTKSVEDRNKAIAELKKLYPDYFKNLDIETAKQYDLAKALEKQRKETRAKLVLMRNEAKQKYEDYKKEHEQHQRTQSSGVMIAGTTGASTAGIALAQSAQKLNDLKKAAEAATQAVVDFDKEYSNTGTETKTEENKENKDPGYESDAERRAREARERKEEAARKKALKNAVDAQKAVADAENAINIQQYSQGLITYRKYLAKRNEIALAEQDALIKVYGEDSDEAKRCLETKEQLQMRYSDKVNQLNEDDIKRYHTRNAIALKEAYETEGSELYHNDMALQEALFTNEMMMLYNRRDLYARGSEEWLNIDAQITELDEEHKLEVRQRYADMLQQYRQNWARRDIGTEKAVTLRGLDELHAAGLIKEDEYQSMKREIALRYAEMEAEQGADNSQRATTSRNAGSAYNAAKNKTSEKLGAKGGTSLGDYLTGDVDMYKGVMEQLKSMQEEGLISHEEYLEAMNNANADFAQGMVSKMQAAYDAVAPIMNAMSTLFQAQQKQEENAVTKKYDKMIDAAGKNQRKQKRLEEQKQKELARIKTEYNKKAMAMEIAQATATMLLGAMNAYTSTMKGVPAPANLVMAPIAAGLALAAGAINIAAIKKQHDAEAAGYYSGGFTGGKEYREVAGVVHQGEFVANHGAVANSRILPALELIDQAQRNNTVASLTADDITRAVGGSQTVVSAPVVNVTTDNKEMAQTMGEAREAIGGLTRLLENGIHASVTMDGEDGFVRAQKKWNQLQKNR